MFTVNLFTVNPHLNRNAKSVLVSPWFKSVHEVAV